jgi:hypothetical protein
MSIEALVAEPGDVVEFERDGQLFGGVVWQPQTPAQLGNMLAGDTYIRLNWKWIATTEHVVSHRRRHERESVGTDDGRV